MVETSNQTTVLEAQIHEIYKRIRHLKIDDPVRMLEERNMASLQRELWELRGDTFTGKWVLTEESDRMEG